MTVVTFKLRGEDVISKEGVTVLIASIDVAPEKKNNVPFGPSVCKSHLSTSQVLYFSRIMHK